MRNRFPRTKISRQLAQLEDEVANWATHYLQWAHDSDEPLKQPELFERAYGLEELQRLIHEAADFASDIRPLRYRPFR